MFAHTETAVRGLTGRRRAGLLAALAAGLFAAALAGASQASALTFVHSAKSGELKGGRLILHGVGGRVTYTSSGRSGTATLKHVHKGVFLPGRPATGVLHVAGNRGGDERVFRLSQPRYNPARRTLSFKARPLKTKRFPQAAGSTHTHTSLFDTSTSLFAASSLYAAGTAQQAGSFGHSSLTVTPKAQSQDHPTGYGGNECAVAVQIDNVHAPGTRTTLYPYTIAKWDTDTWGSEGPDQSKLDTDYDYDYASFGGDLRGCSNTVIFGWLDGNYQANPPGYFRIAMGWAWGELWTTTCNGDPNYAVMYGNGDYACTRAADQANGAVTWKIARRW